MGVLSERATRYVSGPAWEPLREKYFTICEKFLGLDSNAKGELTTIYIKMSILTEAGEQVYAVIWLKSSKQLMVGMALPDDGTPSSILTDAPKGYKYKGLTKYFSILPGDTLPAELDVWAKQAYENVANRTSVEE